MKLKLRDTGLCFKKTKSKCDQYLRRNKNEIKTKDTGLCFKKTKLKCDQYLSCNVNARFFISHTFVSEIRPKLAKIKQKLSSTMRLNFFYWKIICFLHPRFYHNFSGYWGKNNTVYPKKSAKTSVSVLMRLYD